MNQEVFERNWLEMRGQVKEWWDELTDDDLDQVQDTADQIISLLQKRYGTSPLYAQKEYTRRVEAAELGYSGVLTWKISIF
jgi:uncharacterized protein YjbJ (UPF0337 family)